MPSAFWDQYVDPAIMDWFHHEGDIRRAKIALCELDNFAEHMILFLNPSLKVMKGVGRERDRLCSLVAELGIARDIHDTHKHGRLSRRSATITTPTIDTVWNLFPPLGGLESTELWITDNAGRHHELSQIIWKCRDYWLNELRRAGLKP